MKLPCGRRKRSRESKFVKYAIDFAVLAVNTLMYLYLAGGLFVTLMSIADSLPFCLNHRYVPMHMMPFEDAWKGRGDFIRQIRLNVIMTVTFGFLYPFCRRADEKNCSFPRCLLATMTLSLTIELL